MSTVQATIQNKKLLTLVLNPANSAIQGVPVWTVTPTGGVSLFPAANGMSCDVVNLSPMIQTVTVTATPAATPSNPSPTPLIATQVIQTLPVPATSMSISVGPEGS